jgi:alpha-tubulin suppressor-like RCC1 family protein
VESIRPVKVENLPPATTVAAGGYHTCALTRAGAVWCWGDNTYGQLGDGTTHPSRRPVRVDGLPSASGIAGGGDDTCALTRSRAVWCWGDNQFGELGDGTTHDRHAPVAVTGLPPVAALAVGPLHTCALTMKARVACWGENLDGELGDGTKMNRVRPVSVSGLHGTVSAITAGGWESDTGTLDEYTCALTTTGAIECWGGNFFGYLGDGTTHAREMPVSVTGFGPRGR